LRLFDLGLCAGKIKLLPMNAGAILSTTENDKERFAKLFGG